MGQVAEGAGWMWVTEVQIRRPSRDLHKHMVEPMLREPAPKLLPADAHFSSCFPSLGWESGI